MEMYCVLQAPRILVSLSFFFTRTVFLCMKFELFQIGLPMHFRNKFKMHIIICYSRGVNLYRYIFINCLLFGLITGNNL